MSFQDMVAFTLLLGGCASPAATVGGSTGDTAAMERTSISYLGNSNHLFGTAVAVAESWLAVGAPGLFRGWGEEGFGTAVFVLSAPFEAGDAFDGAALHDPLVEGDATHGMGTRLAVVDDVTGDGVADLAVFGDPRCYEPERTAWVFPGPFVPGEGRRNTDPDVLQLGSAVDGVRCSDQSGDGVDDLCLNTGVYAVPVLAGASPVVAWTGLTMLASADLDGDGLDELFAWDEGSAALRSFVSGVVTATWQVPPGQGVQSLDAAGDLDGDRREDLVVLSGGTVFVLTDPAGGPLTEARVQVGSGVQDVAVGDLDGDGQADLALGGVPGPEPAHIRVALFRGPLDPGRQEVSTLDGELLPEAPASGCCDTFGSALDVGDVDGDGAVDVVVGDAEWQGQQEGQGRATVFFGPFVLE